jgi:hypothetical protein
MAAPTSADATAATKTQVFLEPDDEIRGQRYVCLSFLTPEKALMRNKETFMVSRFLEFFAMDYKIRATESFILGQYRELQSTLSDVELALENAATDASAGPALFREQGARLQKLRETIAKRSAAELEAHVKANLSDFKESAILEAWERYMLTNRQKLEDEFHRSVGFRLSMHGLKVRGVYDSNEHAVARAKMLHKKDPYHNVYVADVGQWLPWDPEPDEVAESEYSNDQLNKLMTAYRDNAAKRDAFFEEEKRQRMEEAASAAAAAKKATFGARGKEVEASEVGREMFDGVEADLAIARRAGDNQGAGASGGIESTGADKIKHA